MVSKTIIQSWSTWFSMVSSTLQSRVWILLRKFTSIRAKTFITIVWLSNYDRLVIAQIMCQGWYKKALSDVIEDTRIPDFLPLLLLCHLFKEPNNGKADTKTRFNSTAWNTGSSPTARCLRTRPSVPAMTRSTPSSPRLELENTFRGLSPIFLSLDLQLQRRQLQPPTVVESWSNWGVQELTGGKVASDVAQ